MSPGPSHLGVPPLVDRRTCARTGCDVVYTNPHDGGWPARLCSAECHRLEMRKVPSLAKGRGLSVHPVQRAAVYGRACLVCAGQPVDPAHLIDRSLVADLDDPLAVVPLCRHCHRLYDEGTGAGTLDLLPYLEPHYREHLAFAVARHGLLATLQRITNRTWITEETT